MNRNCVYYCLYGDVAYKQLLETSLRSLSKYLPKENIVVFSEYEIGELEGYCRILKTEFPKGHASPMGYRLILGANLLEQYQRIIHLDVDTVVTGNIDDVFNEIKQGEISFATENVDHPDKIIGDFWAGPLLTQEEKDRYKDIDSICCGIFGFDRSTSHRLKEIYNFIVECERNGFYGRCCDQHAFAAYVLKNNLFNFTLQKHVTHISQRLLWEGRIDSNIKVHHFAGGVTSEGKHQLMKELLTIIGG
jgi:hypothetical protein